MDEAEVILREEVLDFLKSRAYVLHVSGPQPVGYL